MTPTLIVLALVVIGVGVVVWATRRKTVSNPVAPDEKDTAWNDPVHPSAPHKPDESPRDRPLP